MPLNRQNWAGWNFMQRNDEDDPCVTKWINLLQPFIDRGQNYFITLNPPIEPKNILCETEYAFPQYSSSAAFGWHHLTNIQGIYRAWFCGPWCGYGFHEDGLSAGLAVGEALGGTERPWLVNETSSAGQNCRPSFE